MHRVGERVHVGKPAQPGGERFDGIDCARGEKQQRIQHTENGTWNERIVNAHHYEKHEADHGNGRHQNDDGHIKKADRIPQAWNPRKQSTYNRQDQARHHPLHPSRADQPQNQLRTVDGRDEVPLMQAAGLIVDKRYAATDHGHDEDGHGDGAGKQILNVFDVRIDLDDVEDYLALEARPDSGRVQLIDHLLDALEERAGNELVGIVLGECDSRAVVLVITARKIIRNLDHTTKEPGAKIIHGACDGIVLHDAKRFRASRDSMEHFTDLAGLRRLILIYNANHGVMDLPAKGIAEHDELHERENHRAHHQGGAAQKLPHVAFDQSRDAKQLHGRALLSLWRRHCTHLPLTVEVADVIAGSSMRSITQITARVVQEDIIERGALH